MRSFRQTLADAPILRKLYVGLGAALVVFLGYAANAIHEFGKIREKFHEFSDIAYDARSAARIARDFVNLQLQAREFLAAREGDDAEYFIQAHASLAADLIAARKHIQKPEWVALYNEIIALKDQYDLGFVRVRTLNDRRNILVNDILNPTGQRIREALTQINESAYRDRDYQSANYAGVVQEDLLTARLYVNQFLGTNNLADVQRVFEEFNKIAAALVTLDKSLEDPERRRILDSVKADLPVYHRAFNDLVGVITERNDIRTEVFDKIGAEILAKAGVIELSTAADNKALGNDVAEAIQLQVIEGIVTAMLAFIAAFAIAGFIGRSIDGPIREMTGAMRRLAAGDTAHAIPGTDRKDEVGTMAAAVQVFKENMIETLRLREAEKSALQTAESASRGKSEFLSRMSHELRTPMNAILGFAQILKTDRDLNPDQRESVRIILKAGQHLLTLINEVLDLAQVEAGRMSLSIEDVSLAELYDDCESFIAPIAREKGVAVDFQPPRGLPFVRADRVRLKQALINLLASAVKYNRPKGSVRVTAERFGGGQVRVAVEDTGPGIPVELQRELFTPFVRPGNEFTAVEGSGLGLSLTKMIVEAMGGSIGFESTLGVGNIFWIVLPAAAKAGATAAAPKVKDSKTRKATVLYVEDNPLNQKLVRQILGVYSGIDLIEAQTGCFGLDLAAAHRPDLILLDINLPGISGLEVVARLRADPITRATPVIAISAAAMHEDIARAMAAGFNDYVTKPIDITALIEKVSHYLHRQVPKTNAINDG